MLANVVANVIATAVTLAVPVASPSVEPARVAARPVTVNLEGIRFELPGGLDHLFEQHEGRPVHVGRSVEAGKAVLVSTMPAEAEMACDPSAQSVKARAFRTERGLRACSVSADAEGEQVAIVLVQREDVTVTVTVVAVGTAAEELATTVAHTVEIPTRLAATASGPAPRRGDLSL